MKKYIKYIPVIASLVGLSSCISDDTSNVSRVTNYPIFEVIGGSETLIEQGTTYVEQGAIAKEGDSEIDVVTSNSKGVYWEEEGVDTGFPDNYVITYSATNVDGIEGSTIRDNVWVAKTGDLVTSIEGLYTSTIDRVGSNTDFENLKYVIIKKTGTDTYEISCALGGYYDIGRSFGVGYVAKGAVITATDIPNNVFTATQATFPVWGNTADISGITVDPVAKTISFSSLTDFGSTFEVVLTQVEIN